MTMPSAYRVAPADSKKKTTPTKLNHAQMEQLQDQGFTRGLASSMNEIKTVFPLRIWIVDNSGSMKTKDGHRIVDTGYRKNVAMAPCSRWEELRDCVNYHINLAGLIEAPTKFRLLNAPQNGAQEFSVAVDPAMATIDTELALKNMGIVQPSGGTPLAHHISEIQKEVFCMAPELRSAGQKVVIVIATDGTPTDTSQQGFVESLRQLEGLPVWVVIRLCTDDDKVVNFYNELDGQLELSIEVLDDFCGEAQEVWADNPWLNYAIPLHRLREMGYHDRVFDMLDERALTKAEIRDFCGLLFGEEKLDGVPEPSLEWEAFVDHVDGLVNSEKPQWNPILKRMTPWMKTSTLKHIHAECFCTIL